MSFLLAVLKPVAYVSVPAYLVSKSSARGRAYVRLGVYVACLTAVATCAAVVAAGMALVGRKFDVNFVVARSFYALASSVLGVAVEIDGEEHLDNSRPAVVIMNHQSILDILIVGRVMPRQTSIMAKQSLKLSPVGPFMMMSGAIFIDRKNNAKAVQSLQAAAKEMQAEKVSLWIFPEGTRHMHREPALLPFKKGGFHLAIQAGIPVVPIVTENYWRLYRPGVFETGVLKIKVLPPVQTSGLQPEEAGDLSNRIHEQMTSTLQEISVTLPASPSPSSSSSTTQSHPQPTSTSTSTHPPPPPQATALRVEPSFPPRTDVTLPGSLSGLSPSESRESLTTGSSSSVYDVPSNNGASASGSADASPGDSPVLGESAEGQRRRRTAPSEASTSTGTETEEDEGMVLVGRPA